MLLDPQVCSTNPILFNSPVMSSLTLPTSSIEHAVQPPNSINSSSATGPNYISSPSSDADDTDSDQSVTLAPRPRLDVRRPSGTSIVPRDHPDVEIRNEVFPPNDARAMSPRRSSLEIEKLGEDARRSLQLWVISLTLVCVILNVYLSLRDLTSLDICMLSRINVFFRFPTRHAQTLQSGLNALAAKIEMVKSDHERLEKQNLALQDYIGGLTRSMSKTDLTSKSKK